MAATAILNCARTPHRKLMSTPDATRKTLIAKVKSGDPIAWEEFYNTYKVFIRNVALGLKNSKYYHLTDEDIADVIQNVMLDLWKPGRFRFDPAVGVKFRTWFSRIVRNKLLDLVRKKTRGKPADCSGPAEEDYPVEQFQQVWNAEWNRALFDDAMNQLRLRPEVESSTFNVFEMLLQGLSAQEVATRAGIKENNVYQIKHRYLTILRAIYEGLRAEH